MADKPELCSDRLYLRRHFFTADDIAVVLFTSRCVCQPISTCQRADAMAFDLAESSFFAFYLKCSRIPHPVPPIISGDPGLYSEHTSTREPAQFGVCYHGADWRDVAITCDTLGENAFRSSARDRNWSCLHGGQLCDDALFSGHTSDGGNASSGAVFLRLDSLLSAFFCSVTLLCR